MKRLFFLNSRQTQITHLFSPRTPGEAVAEARNAESDEADAIAVDLNNMSAEFRTEESFRSIIAGVPLPFMFLLYRSDPLGWDDDRRMNMLLDAARAGAGMIDVMGDLFDKSPDERTRNPEAIRKQMKVIEEIHALGSQVIMSSHPLRPMKTEEVLDQLKDFEQRGADVVKIVTTADTDEEFTESIRTTLTLHRQLKTPFVHLCGGKFSRVQRMFGTALGTAITFAVYEYHDFTAYTQPTIRAFREIMGNMHWNIADVLQE